MPLAQVSVLPGATDDQKRAVIASVTDALATSLSLDKNAVRVLISEVAPSCWGVAGLPLSDRERRS